MFNASTSALLARDTSKYSSQRRTPRALDRLSGYPSRLLAGQEHCQTSQVICVSQTVVNSLLVLEHFQELVREVRVDVGREEARVDGVGSDTVGLAQ